MTLGPVYTGGTRTETAWMKDVQFSLEQTTKLAGICSDCMFIEGLRQIACRVHNEHTLKIDVTKAEEIATLKDVIETVSKLLSQLEKMPGRVDAILWRVQDEIRDTKLALTIISAIGKKEISNIESKPKSKGGRPKKDNPRIIANLTKKHFERHGLKTSGTTWETGKWPLIDALEIIFDAAGDPKERSAIIEYLK